MQPLAKVREVSSEGITESTAFAISIKDSAHIKSILRDNIYSDKVLAVLREYSANAWDAHRMAGKSHVPIKIQLPTWAEPILKIEDYGTGLSHEDVFTVFTQYGASTKRDSNEAVGMLGIGSKSGFAYSDTFTVVSRHGGKRRTYVALLDESDNDALSLLSEEDCGEDTGLTIQIAIKSDDINEFHSKARELFRHFEPRPEINCELPPVPAIQAKLKHGIIYDRKLGYIESHYWIAVMGCIPYIVKLDQLKDSQGNRLVSESFSKTSGIMFFDIGQLQISASREDLKYSKTTKDALVKKFDDLLEEFVTVSLAELDKGDLTEWQKRLQVQVLLQLGLGKKELGDLGLTAVNLPKCPSFNTDTFIRIRPETRFVRKTEIGRKLITGFRLTSADYIITPQSTYDSNGAIVSTASWDTINVELAQMIIDCKITGIPIVDLHTLPWEPKKPRSTVRNVIKNDKHRVKNFKLVSCSSYSSRSANWEIEDHQPTPDDIFVTLQYFETAHDHFDIYSCRRIDVQLAELLGLSLPPIYGYKTSEKKPLAPEKLIGIPYLDWRKKFYASLSQDKLKELIDAEAWYEAAHEIAHYHHERITSGSLSKLEVVLGTDHTIIAYLARALDHAKERSVAREQVLTSLMDQCVIPSDNSEADIMLKALQGKYPLLRSNGLSNLWNRNSPEWIHYIQSIDRSLANIPTVTPEEVI